MRFRIDHQIIADLIDDNSKILDLGCGNGELLELLISKNKVKYAVGIEKDIKEVEECLKKGINVLHLNIDEDLNILNDNVFDYVILSFTLQSLKKPDKVITEMIRIGKKAIVSFPNFGNIWIRLYLLFKGKMPKSKFLPYEWYNTPNIHFCSIKDFEALCQEKSIKITKKIYLKKFDKKIKSFMPNLFASLAIFVLEK
ncbi:MAG TPA: methionine biosynthesis protein MetW [Spirochaetota bacterium]|nr:methionine biosynthesis protein MetW [Spirochaetota bacterium]HOM38836.1 methionine biosynthesis protein MetW [Spirochaetota bacterium]HPQ49894.1 methionine biosynthesis protein MetW [Spirochaetota bacterium]